MHIMHSRNLNFLVENILIIIILALGIAEFEKHEFNNLTI